MNFLLITEFCKVATGGPDVCTSGGKKNRRVHRFVTVRSGLRKLLRGTDQLSSSDGASRFFRTGHVPLGLGQL